MHIAQVSKKARQAAIGAALASAAVLAMPTSAYAVGVGGTTSTGCSSASGVYNWTKTGETSTYSTYDAFFDISVRDSCNGDGWAAGLYLSYRKYSNGIWSWNSMQRVRTNGTYNTTLRNVEGVQINVCDYYPDKAPRGCYRVF
ncbi:hypothetical protein [Streptomyces lushanensis]|uniref:hypothetical protein n=1 Tax=Streptomyces lushanensis TaxID=1434255 RepID=UPI00082E4426|nr:hypothetical protein [Streptomyces lushanensis]